MVVNYDVLYGETNANEKASSARRSYNMVKVRSGMVMVAAVEVEIFLETTVVDYRIIKDPSDRNLQNQPVMH